MDFISKIWYGAFATQSFLQKCTSQGNTKMLRIAMTHAPRPWLLEILPELSEKCVDSRILDAILQFIEMPDEKHVVDAIIAKAIPRDNVELVAHVLKRFPTTTINLCKKSIQDILSCKMACMLAQRTDVAYFLLCGTPTIQKATLESAYSSTDVLSHVVSLIVKPCITTKVPGDVISLAFSLGGICILDHTVVDDMRCVPFSHKALFDCILEKANVASVLVHMVLYTIADMNLGGAIKCIDAMSKEQIQTITVYQATVHGYIPMSLLGFACFHRAVEISRYLISVKKDNPRWMFRITRTCDSASAHAKMFGTSMF